MPRQRAQWGSGVVLLKGQLGPAPKAEERSGTGHHPGGKALGRPSGTGEDGLPPYGAPVDRTGPPPSLHRIAQHGSRQRLGRDRRPPIGGVRRAVRSQPPALLHRPLHLRPAPDADRLLGIGAGARFRFQTFPRHLWMDTVITEVEEPQRIVEHGHGGRANRIPSTTVWELLEGPGSLITVRVSFWTEPSNHIDRAIDAVGMASVGLQRGWREAVNRLRDSSRPAPASGSRSRSPAATPTPPAFPDPVFIDSRRRWPDSPQAPASAARRDPPDRNRRRRLRLRLLERGRHRRWSRARR